jgi:F-type H+-transporting ATPase subunit epsilon
MMNEFELAIVTPEGAVYSGPARNLILRTTEGNIGILADHAPLTTSLAEGSAALQSQEAVRHAEHGGGFISVRQNTVQVAASYWHWTDQKD